ncbi:hypothetical protein F7725_021876 [Dissostichus mawsoni]|uniref:Uncharacterized protein n=1 Tax=Dissostichus mawsoni TaxID=36200 RepID=A0A7J5ZFR4_DISMA|nr:hypothetical protein F7725_021876 [Dissostichus mawsoni]
MRIYQLQGTVYLEGIFFPADMKKGVVSGLFTLSSTGTCAGQLNVDGASCVFVCVGVWAGAAGDAAKASTEKLMEACLNHCDENTSCLFLWYKLAVASPDNGHSSNHTLTHTHTYRGRCVWPAAHTSAADSAAF